MLEIDSIGPDILGCDNRNLIFESSAGEFSVKVWGPPNNVLPLNLKIVLIISYHKRTFSTGKKKIL